jgi:hypothetical protein
MSTLAINDLKSVARRSGHEVSATGVRFKRNTMFVALSDGREISVPLERYRWAKWLLKATPKQRAQWKVEPGGDAVYWENLDDGFEVSHLLALTPLS